jgi:hypothetical protein
VKQTGSRLGRFDWETITGVRMVVAAFGILCGLTGVIAGCFEISQGDVETGGFVISTIGPEYGLADDFTYFAFTIVPNMLVTGILAIVLSIAAAAWAIGFVHKKNGTPVLLGLFVGQTLVGGGWILDLAIITIILATRIGKPLTWWRSHFPIGLRIWFARLLLPALSSYVVISFGLLALTILSVGNPSLMTFMDPTAAVMFIPMVLMIFGALAHDVGRPLRVQIQDTTRM